MFLAQNAGTIQGRVLLQVSLKVRVLFEGGHYSRAGLNNDFTVIINQGPSFKMQFNCNGKNEVMFSKVLGR